RVRLRNPPVRPPAPLGVRTDGPAARGRLPQAGRVVDAGEVVFEQRPGDVELPGQQLRSHGGHRRSLAAGPGAGNAVSPGVRRTAGRTGEWGGAGWHRTRDAARGAAPRASEAQGERRGVPEEARGDL